VANLVEQINDALESVIAAELGSDYKELAWKLLLDKNNFRGSTKRYGVRPLGGVSVGGVLKSYTIDQPFEVILTHDFVNQGGDTDQQEKSFLLFDKMDSILKKIIQTKAGIPAVVVNIEGFTLRDPEFFELEHVAVQRMPVTVKYRGSLL